ncbi:MAG: radical SAM protein [Desulfurococcus sp.]|uniref:radical SAM protein n=1 Tax=Desulfurococcus sp. TaxID=51678 RepID=UPI003D09DAE5
MMEVIGRFPGNRIIYRVPGSMPAYGYIAFGVIDRGTNVLQARPTTICPQNCVFCSVDAGIHSLNRWAEYIVDPELIVNGVRKATSVKGEGVEVLLDSMGDVLTYPWLTELVSELKKVPGVSSVAIETHGLLLNKYIIDKLDEAGLDRVNLSIDVVDNEKAHLIYGTRYYDVRRVMELAEYIVRETNIDLHVTPLWLPGLNDEDVVSIIKWAIKIGAGKRWPPVTIQKYIRHKRGRKPRGVREVSWDRFWKWLSKVEEETGIRLHWSMNEWGMYYARRIRPPVRKGGKIIAEVAGRGLFRGEYIGVIGGKDYLVTIIPKGKNLKPTEKVLVEIVEDQDGLLIGRMLDTLPS